jgi:ABC-type transporter Mla maintaining outer membrane lipid asymmetry ATPase subunit MlaF
MSQATGIAPQILSENPDETSAALARFTLGRGHSYRVIAPAVAARVQYVRLLAQSDLCAVVPGDGGFIGNLRVWENLMLPAVYHGRPRATDLAARATEFIGALGGNPAEARQLCGALPECLSPLDRRRAALVRAMLCEPEVIVYDALFDGLTNAEVETVRGFDRVFHRYFPFRTAVWVDHDAPGLPAVAVNATFTLEP